MRASIGLVLMAAMLAGGCDRRSPAPRQGDEVVAANVASPDEAPAGPAATAPGKIDRTHKGEAAPSFPFKDASGKTLTLAAFRGKPVLVNLWATWCGPCVKELPTLDRLAARKGASLSIVPLSEDLDPAKVAPFFAARHFSALKPYIDDKMAWLPAVTANLPTTILYDSTGHELWRTLGDLDWTGDVATKALAEAR